MSDGVILAIIITGVELVITTAAGMIIKKSVQKRLDRNDELLKIEAEQKKAERKQEVYDALRNELAPVLSKLDKISSGTLSTLRNDILTCYYKCNEKGFRNDYDYTNIHDLYEAYKALDGNSFVADIMERFDSLPTKEAFREKKTRRNDL